MVARKKRIPVVVDANVFVRSFLSRSKKSPNKRVIRLWLEEKRLQFIVSAAVVEEYLEVFDAAVGVERADINKWRTRFERDRRCTLVNLGRRYTESRDPDDNVLLATALAGNAEYLITNDLDLLELPAAFQRTLPFRILTPEEFLQQFEAD